MGIAGFEVALFLCGSLASHKKMFETRDQGEMRIINHLYKILGINASSSSHE